MLSVLNIYVPIIINDIYKYLKKIFFTSLFVYLIIPIIPSSIKSNPIISLKFKENKNKSTELLPPTKESIAKEITTIDSIIIHVVVSGFNDLILLYLGTIINI